MHAVRKGALRGAAVRLYEATDRLAITEGIENALAVRLATGWPTWAATSATLLELSSCRRPYAKSRSGRTTTRPA